MTAEHDHVFTWFNVEVEKKLVLNAFALFTLSHEKVTKVVEVVSPVKSFGNK